MTGNDMFGDSVNIAGRIQPIAEPGGICITADVYNIIKKTLDIKVVNLGVQDLKNIKISPEIYKIIIDAVQRT